MTKRYRRFLYYDTKFSFGSFSKIQADFMHVESWTGVLQVQPCFEIIYNFIFGVLLNSTVFVTARDIYSFLILSNQLQIHENAIEIGLNLKQGFKCAKYPICLWIITLMYLTGRTNKSQSVLPRVWPSTYLNQFLIQPHPHFSATVNIYLNLIESL